VVRSSNATIVMRKVIKRDCTKRKDLRDEKPSIVEIAKGLSLFNIGYESSGNC